MLVMNQSITEKINLEAKTFIELLLNLKDSEKLLSTDYEEIFIFSNFAVICKDVLEQEPYREPPYQSAIYTIITNTLYSPLNSEKYEMTPHSIVYQIYGRRSLQSAKIDELYRNNNAGDKFLCYGPFFDNGGDESLNLLYEMEDVLKKYINSATKTGIEVVRLEPSKDKNRPMVYSYGREM